MKRFIAMITLALTAGCVLPADAQGFTGDVYSVNIFSYKKVDATPGDQMMAMPFLANPRNVNDVIGGQFQAGYSPTTADNLIFYDEDSQTYRILYLLGEIGDPDYDFKWIDTSTGEVADFDLIPGKGFWFRNRKDEDQMVLFLGEAVRDDEADVEIVNGYQIVAYPFSSSIAVNDTSLKNDAVAGNSMNTSDNIVFYDGENFKYMYLVGDVGDPQLDFKWIDSSSLQPATNVFVPGQAFWYRHRGEGFTWTETKPYATP